MKRKRDEGHEETDKILEDMEKRIAEEYKQAEKEISKKLNDYLRRFEAKDRIKQQALADGLITQEEYDKWLTGQIMIGKRWTEMRDTLAEDFTNADKIAKSIAYGYQPEVYALNHNYGTYQVEKGAQVDTSYTLYDRNTVERLFNDNETFYHAPGKKVSARINEGKALAWNKKQVQSCMLQGILQGESIPNMATRLANTVGEQNRKAAIRNARTMTTGVENAGRVRSYDRAQSMGINVQKQWLATLDNRTRHWHRELDGASVPNDEPFKNEFGEIMYPGDPTADGSNIYNCRCTLIANIKGFENDVTNRSLRHDTHLGDMSYDEWKESHESESNSITRQEEVGEAMRQSYNAEYSRLDRLNHEAESGNIKYRKNIELPDSIYNISGMTEDTKNAISEAFDRLSSEYNIGVPMAVESLGKGNEKVPFQFIPINKGGYYEAKIAINSDYYFNDSLEAFKARIMRNHESGALASKDVEDLIAHEVAHVLTFKECETWGQFEALEEEIRYSFVRGISNYADSTYDGAESIAEGFVKKRRGEDIPSELSDLINKHIERWRL